MRHDIDIQTELFELVNIGLRHALPLPDVAEGDTVILHEHDPLSGRYSGRWVEVTIVDRHPEITSVARFTPVRTGVARPYFKTESGTRVVAA